MRKQDSKMTEHRDPTGMAGTPMDRNYGLKRADLVLKSSTSSHDADQFSNKNVKNRHVSQRTFF